MGRFIRIFLQSEVVKFEPYDVFTENESKQEAIIRSENEAFNAICLKDTKKLIGNIYLSKQAFDTWEIGYVFNEKYHRNGFATEAPQFLINDVFTNQNARRVIVMCNPLNQQSWKLLGRLGMRREGHLLQDIYLKKDIQGNPIWSDTYEYAVLASE